MRQHNRKINKKKKKRGEKGESLDHHRGGKPLHGGGSLVNRLTKERLYKEWRWKDRYIGEREKRSFGVLGRGLLVINWSSLEIACLLHLRAFPFLFWGGGVGLLTLPKIKD